MTSFAWYMGIGKNTLNQFKINKKKFHASKQPTDLNLVDIRKIVPASRIEHGDKSFKYFICYAGNVITPLYIKLPHCGNGGKNIIHGQKR